MVCSLPYDVQLAISRALPVRDILILKATCKELHKTLESRNVWLHVLRDILCTIPLPHLRLALPRLSTHELKMKAIIAASLADRWGRETVIARKTRTLKYHHNIAHFQILPGGKWLVVAGCDGSLELYNMTSEPPEVEVIQRPLGMDSRNIQADLRLFVSEDGSILVILHISIDLRDDEESSEISVFRIDMETNPFIRLVTKAIKHCDIRAYCAEGDLFAFAWSDDVSLGLSVTVRNMALALDHVGRDAHLDPSIPLDEDSYPSIAMAIIPTRKLLISTESQLMVYDIPSFGTATALGGTLVWKQQFDGTTCRMHAPSIQVIHPTREAHSEGLVIIFTRNVFMALAPSPDHSGGYHLRVFEHPEVQQRGTFDVVHLSSRRFFFWLDEYMTLTTCTLALSETNNGSMRLRQAAPKSGCIDRMRSILLDETSTYTSPLSAAVPLLDTGKASIDRMSWDEESGQLCLLVAADGPNVYEPFRNEFVVIDFV